jgi:hypothetical protein
VLAAGSETVAFGWSRSMGGFIASDFIWFIETIPLAKKWPATSDQLSCGLFEEGCSALFELEFFYAR